MSSRLRAFLAAVQHPFAPQRAILGIDHGTLKCGIAIADSLQGRARRLETIRVSSGTPLSAAHGQFAAAVKDMALELRVAGIVMGWPLDPFGQESTECGHVTLLVARLRAAGLHAPILLWDERGTSAQAKAAIRAAAGSGPRAQGKAVRIGLSPEQRRLVDEEAAVALLDNFLAAAAQGG